MVDYLQRSLLLSVLLLSACGASIDTRLKEGCLRFTKLQADTAPGREVRFCDCLLVELADMPNNEKRAIADLLDTKHTPESLIDGIQHARTDGDLSMAGMASLLSSGKSCSRNLTE